MGQVKKYFIFATVLSKIEGYESDYAELASILMDGAHSYGCSRLHFDTREELLWSGSESGHITRSRSNIPIQGTGLRSSENESIILGHFRPF